MLIIYICWIELIKFWVILSPFKESFSYTILENLILLLIQESELQSLVQLVFIIFNQGLMGKTIAARLGAIGSHLVMPIAK
jgi:hypothetical protein